ncbi:Z1 domain-containing protein [Caulobacter sp. 17J65-9]|uniref:Z1 domain-containing protein n=1 Tax=Caulobacter sp. 17J65-9 TaxID=2709382 RepID=UPI0013C9E8FF|nr:Z1 domain-containing protein [Caulobacter sp. 17J65-9]NEX92971.1 Z1 domain-containing protein [Caulobacter sp. 17J65-9]
MNQKSAVGRLSPQIEGWIRQIQKEQAAGLDLDKAALEARSSFEGLLGQPLDPQQLASWEAAREEVRRQLEQPIEFLDPHSLRKPRRPDWYAGPHVSDTHWPPLRAHLLGRRRWSEKTVSDLDVTSTEVVRLLENPSQSAFAGRGLVVGYVQSGKTANMLGVIAKAVDAGYRFVIILAGLTNSLRKQTQGRFESDLRARTPHAWHLHTSYDDDGDFRTPPNRWFSMMDAAQVAVVKKNVTPLERLIETIERTPASLRERMPVLIIDDECDQASVNASGSQYDIKAINGAIRRLLSILPRCQYVGYTATPFANILINPKTPAGVLDDLYPTDFITALPLPEGYFGAETLFGREPVDAGEETGDEQGLDMIREVLPAEVALVRPPSAKGREGFQPAVPDSLGRALSYFLLATAARYARGQRDQHCSMLVHTTVYTSTHEKLSTAIRTWLAEVGAQLGTADLETSLEDLWTEESARIDGSRWALGRVPWEALRPHLESVLADVEVVVENSNSDTRLDFEAGPAKYIVIGGSVLARGLTIEGLTVSYFVRSSSQYDTLLQMGRWFGYRPGYQDLPRIWMTADLAAAFRDLATVEAEIRADIAEYIRRDQTPEEFAVRIRQIPGMTITAASKMIAAEACDISFSGEHLQTIRFQHRDEAVSDTNWAAAEALVEAGVERSNVESRPGGRLIRNVPLSTVLAFLSTYSASPKDRLSNDLLDYIRSEARDGATFQSWNVGVVEPTEGTPSSRPLGPLDSVRLVRRSRLALPRSDGAADIKALMSRRDILMDTDEGVTGGDWESLKRARQAQVGDGVPLLLLYAIEARSMPARDSRYRVALDAVRDLIGVGLVLPDRGRQRSYVRVRLDRPDADGENLLADLTEAT